MRVSEVMDRDLTAVTEDMSLAEAVEVICRHRLAGVPVVDEEGDLVGFLGETDVIRAALPGYVRYLKDVSLMPDLGQFRSRLRRVAREPLSRFMNREPLCFQEGDGEQKAAAELIRHRMKHAPVLRGRRLIGMVNRADLIAHILSGEE
jgi:CBS-domain-containing membrane protein